MKDTNSKLSTSILNLLLMLRFVKLLSVAMLLSKEILTSMSVPDAKRAIVFNAIKNRTKGYHARRIKQTIPTIPNLSLRSLIKEGNDAQSVEL